MGDYQMVSGPCRAEWLKQINCIDCIFWQHLLRLKIGMIYQLMDLYGFGFLI